MSGNSERAKYANKITEMAFVSIPGKPGIAFQGTRDECMEWSVQYSKQHQTVARVHYLTAEPAKKKE
jgi:hypothetical protein